MPSQFAVHAANDIIGPQLRSIASRAVYFIESCQCESLFDKRLRRPFLADDKNPGRGRVGSLGQIQGGCHGGSQDFTTVHSHSHAGEFVDILFRCLAGVVCRQDETNLTFAQGFKKFNQARQGLVAMP